MAQSSERRQFKRLNAPVFCKPLGRPHAAQEQKQKVEDISLGGVRVYTDDRHKIGERLELELWLPGGESVALDTQVVWIEPLTDKDAPAKFEVGLKYVDVNSEDLARIEAVLKDAP